MIQRILLLGILILAVYTVCFFALEGAIRLNPARVFLGPMARQDDVEALRKKWALDQNLAQRYVRQMALLLRGDLGDSLFYRRGTTALLGATLPPTLLAAGIASLIALLLSFPCAMALTFARECRLRRYAEFALNACQSLPSFVYLFLSLWTASRLLRLTPLRAVWFYWTMAALLAAIYPWAAATLNLSRRLELYRQPMSHVSFERAMGLPPWRIGLRLMKELLPAGLTIVVSSLGAVFTTVFFAEFVFGLNGFGALLLRSASRGDTPVIMGGVLTASVLFLGAQLATDYIHGFLDPRVRTVWETEEIR